MLRWARLLLAVLLFPRHISRAIERCDETPPSPPGRLAKVLLHGAGGVATFFVLEKVYGSFGLLKGVDPGIWGFVFAPLLLIGGLAVLVLLVVILPILLSLLPTAAYAVVRMLATSLRSELALLARVEQGDSTVLARIRDARSSGKEL